MRHKCAVHIIIANLHQNICAHLRILSGREKYVFKLQDNNNC